MHMEICTKKTISKIIIIIIIIIIINHTFPAKKSLTPFLKVAIVVA